MNFFDIPMVNILLSVVISWALFAMLCSMVHEAIAQAKAERGRFMKRYLFKQLQDEPNGVNWASLLYLHGTIDLLSREPGKPTNDISPHLFAEALIDVVSNMHLVQVNAARATQTAIGLPTGTEVVFKNAALTEATGSYSNAVLHNFKLATQVLHPSDMTMFFRQSLKSAELSALAGDAAENEGQIYNHLLLNIEKWYTEFTQRLTLWYTKATKMRLFLLGIVLGLFLNVDSLELFKIFNINPLVRQAVIGYYQKNADVLPADTPADTSQTKEEQISHFAKQIDTLNQTTNLPIGTQHSFLFHPQQTGEAWFYKILGVLISGFAASLGAPFWFSLLKKATSKK